MSGWRAMALALLSDDGGPPATFPPSDKNDKNDKNPVLGAEKRVSGIFGNFGGFGACQRSADLSVAERLARLALNPPTDLSPTAWRDRFEAAAGFESAWGDKARALGWSEVALYSLHPHGPLIRRDAMGAAFLTTGAEVIAVTPEAVVIGVPPHAVIQRARKPSLVAPVAWATFTPRKEPTDD